MKRGLLLFAHGARDARWALPFEAIAQRIREAEPGLCVVLAYLEFMQPTLPEAGGQLAALGCEHVDVVPLFLGAGGHVRRDLPALLQDLGERHTTVQWRLQEAIGEIDSVIAAMAQAALEMTRSR